MIVPKFLSTKSKLNALNMNSYMLWFWAMECESFMIYTQSFIRSRYANKIIISNVLPTSYQYIKQSIFIFFARSHQLID